MKKIIEKNFFERCWFIYGFKIENYYFGFVKKHSNGIVGGVEFDWKKVWDSKYLIGWFHTHPKNMLAYSDTDYKTMTAWVDCLWKDLVCGIWNEERTKNKCYLFKKYGGLSSMTCYFSKLIFLGKEG